MSEKIAWNFLGSPFALSSEAAAPEEAAAPDDDAPFFFFFLPFFLGILGEMEGREGLLSVYSGCVHWIRWLAFGVGPESPTGVGCLKPSNQEKGEPESPGWKDDV